LPDGAGRQMRELFEVKGEFVFVVEKEMDGFTGCGARGPLIGFKSKNCCEEEFEMELTG